MDEMAEKEAEGYTEEEGVVNEEVNPEDILGALDDDVVPADDGEGTGEPEGDVTPTEGDEGADEGEGDAQVAPEPGEEPSPVPPEPAALPGSELVPTKIMHQGVEYEVMVPPAAAKAIEAKVLTAEQFAPLQEKYLQNLEATRGIAPQEAVAGQPQFSQKEFESSMQPRIAQAVESGTITEGFAKEFPSETAYGVWLFDAVRQMAGTLHGVSSNIVHDANTAELAEFTQGVHGRMGEMASADPQVFGELADQANREAFFKFVYEANPTVGQLSGDQAGETLKGLYAWYKKDEMSAGVHAAQAHAKAEQDDARLKAGGAGGGGGGRSSPKSKHPDIDAVLGN